MTTDVAELPPRGCPVCAAAQATLVHEQRFAAVGAAALLSGYDVVVCDACGTGYADRIPTQDEFNRHYREQSKYEYHQADGRESPYDLERLRRCAARLAKWLPDRSLQIIDVGCATGGLLAELSRIGYRNLLGIDPSPQCVAAVERLYGLSARVGSLDDLPAALPAADVVIFSCVLEHVREVRPLLRKLASLVKPDGALLIEVPDARRFAECRNAPYQQFSNEHINFFTAASLTNLMRTVGADAEQIAEVGVEVQRGAWEPLVSGLFRRVAGRASAVAPDVGTLPALNEYVESCRAADRRVHERIEALVASHRPVYVWGVGTSTQRLLRESRLDAANIVGFVDSNAHYHGRQLAGREILDPARLADPTLPIVVASFPFYHEIVAQIRERLELANPIISLFDVAEEAAPPG